MEERNLEFDDDGKIKLKRKNENFLQVGDAAAEDEIVIDVPDFKGFGEENEGGAVSDEELARRAAEREKEQSRLRTLAEKTFEEAEALFAAGDLDGAGEKYLDSASLYGGDWRPWFGVVRVQTKDLTEFTGIYDCEQAYDKAFRRMSSEDRKALAAQYGPRLEARADEYAERQKSFTEEDVTLRESERPVLKKKYASVTKIFIVSLVLFFLFAVAGGVLAAFVNSVPGMQILIPCIVCIVAALAMLAVVAVFAKRFVSLRVALTKNARAGTTAAGEQARVCAETEELIRSILEDLAK